MLFLTVNETNAPGDAVRLPANGGTIHVSARAVSDQPLRSLEIVVNGTVAAHASLRTNELEAQLEAAVNLEQGSWVCARATAEDRLLTEDELAGYAKKAGLTESPSRLRLGHTSPVYVTVGGAGAAVPASLHEASLMLDGLQRFALQTAAEEYRPEVLDALQTARQKLKELSAAPHQPGP